MHAAAICTQAQTVGSTFEEATVTLITTVGIVPCTPALLAVMALSTLMLRYTPVVYGQDVWMARLRTMMGACLGEMYSWMASAKLAGSAHRRAALYSASSANMLLSGVVWPATHA